MAEERLTALAVIIHTKKNGKIPKFNEEAIIVLKKKKTDESIWN